MTNEKQWVNESARFSTSTSEFGLGTFVAGYRVFSAVVHVAFMVVALAIHVQQVHVGYQCTLAENSFNSTCYKRSSGTLRALNFTVPTTYLSFSNNDLPYKSTPWDVLFYTGTTDHPHRGSGTDGHLSSNCTYDLAGHDPYEIQACEAQRLRTMYEYENTDEYLTLAGGVHIVFCLWVTLHIAGSFTLFNLPPSFDGTKVHTLPMWYISGFIVTLLIHLEDDYFNMRVPLNNIVLAIILQIFTVIIHFLWAKNYMTDSYSPVQTKLGMPVDPRSSLAIPFGAHHNMIGNTRLSKHARYKSTGPVAPSYHLDVFEQKWDQFSVLELIFMESAFTLPLFFVSVYVIGNRVSMDWEVQSIYIRLFILFALFSLNERLRSLGWKHLDDKLSISRRARVAPLSLFLNAALICTSIFLFVDFIRPFQNGIWLKEVYDLGFKAVRWWTLIGAIMFGLYVFGSSLFNFIYLVMVRMFIILYMCVR